MTVQAYQFAGGYGIVAIPNATVISARDPTTSDTISSDGNPYTPGQYWQNRLTGNLFVYLGGGVWDPVSSSGITVIETLTGDSGGAVPPTLGNVNLFGTANQITTTGTIGTSQIVFSIPTTFIAPGSIASTTTIHSGTSMSAATTITAGTGITSTTGNIVASAGNINATLGSMSAGTTITAGTGITATTGNIVATAGQVNAGTSMTAGTTITATLGNITATAGNFVSSTLGDGFVLNSGTTSGTTTATLNGRSGQITVTTPSIAAGATFTFTITNSSVTASTTQILYGLTGGTTGSAITIQSVTNSASQSVVVVQNASAVTANTASLVLTFLVIN